jgi:GntR family transcriptional repressor for pyruvate dehydrogenase complex
VVHERRDRLVTVEAPPFSAIEQQRAHEYVADQIRRQIGLGLLAPGDTLPPERELASIFGVGRVTVQLAVGLLEADRLIETRRGRSGGRFVVNAGQDTHVLDYRIIEVRRDADVISDAIDFRTIIEPAAARIAARQRRKPELEAIEESFRRTAEARSDAQFTRYDTAFHLAVARATRNRFMLAAVEEARLRVNPALALLPESDLFHAISNEEHSAILHAIADQQPEAAAEHARRHVERTARTVRTLLSSLVPTWPGQPKRRGVNGG